MMVWKCCGRSFTSRNALNAHKRWCKVKAPPLRPACMCIHYESSEEDDDMGMGACHCGHSPEEHTFAGREGPPQAPPPHEAAAHKEK